tara:strand:+ start:2213 stop:2773 length:561 start_codon:yes stop_codon:yes gene_type:complete
LSFFLFAIFLVFFSYNYLAYFFLYLSLIFDYVDGQICRVTNTASYFGKFFDGLVDSIFETTFPIIIALSVYNYTNDKEIIIWGLLSAYFNYAYLYLIIRYSFFLNTVNKQETNYNKIISYITGKMLSDYYDFKYFSFLIFCLFKKELYFVYLITILNITIFFSLFIIKILKSYKFFNIRRKSKSQK